MDSSEEASTSSSTTSKKITINSSVGGGVLFRLVIPNQTKNDDEEKNLRIVEEEREDGVTDDDSLDDNILEDEEIDERRFAEETKMWRQPYTGHPNQYTRKHAVGAGFNEELGDGSYDPDYDWESRIIINEDAERRYKCELCDHLTMHRMNMQEHMVWRHGQKSKFQCDNCRRFYPNSKSKAFREHLEMCSPTPLRQEEKDLLKIMPCKYCGKRFRTVTYLNVHIKIVHKRVRKIQCPHCKFRTNKNSPLECHMIRKHGYQGDYQCNICSKQFHRSLGKLFEAHVRNCARFLQDRQFSCDKCGHRFVKLISLNEHIRKYHSEERFTCDHCNKDFISNELLARHYLNRHGYETDTQCPKCNLTFSAFAVLAFEDHIMKCGGVAEGEEDYDT